MDDIEALINLVRSQQEVLKYTYSTLENAAKESKETLNSVKTFKRTVCQATKLYKQLCTKPLPAPIKEPEEHKSSIEELSPCEAEKHPVKAGNQVGNQARNQGGYQSRNQGRNQGGNQARNQGRDQIRNQVRNQMPNHGRNPVRTQQTRINNNTNSRQALSRANSRDVSRVTKPTASKPLSRVPKPLPNSNPNHTRTQIKPALAYSPHRDSIVRGTKQDLQSVREIMKNGPPVASPSTRKRVNRRPTVREIQQMEIPTVKRTRRPLYETPNKINQNKINQNKTNKINQSKLNKNNQNQNQNQNQNPNRQTALKSNANSQLRQNRVPSTPNASRTIAPNFSSTPRTGTRTGPGRNQNRKDANANANSNANTNATPNWKGMDIQARRESLRSIMSHL